MGSVPDIYTTGDNDPEIEPVQYYRHYLYCDACGSFELDSWIVPDNHGILEKTRQRLAMAARGLGGSRKRHSSVCLPWRWRIGSAASSPLPRRCFSPE